MKKEYYTTSLQHILAELERIDLLIQVQVQRARQVQESNCEFQGLCISEQEIDALLKQPVGLPLWASALSPWSRTKVWTAFDQMAADIGKRKAESARQGITLRLEELALLFHLTPFDVDTLLICLTLELDLRYERLYAYLQDDVTKKRSSVDLVLNLLCPSFQDKLVARDRFSSESPLFKHYLLHLFDDPSHQNPSLLSKYLKVDERVVNYLFDSDQIDIRLQSCARLSVPQTSKVKEALAELVDKGLVLSTKEKDSRTHYRTNWRQHGEILLLIRQDLEDTKKTANQHNIWIFQKQKRCKFSAILGLPFVYKCTDSHINLIKRIKVPTCCG